MRLLFAIVSIALIFSSCSSSRRSSRSSKTNYDSVSTSGSRVKKHDGDSSGSHKVDSSSISISSVKGKKIHISAVFTPGDSSLSSNKPGDRTVWLNGSDSLLFSVDTANKIGKVLFPRRTKSIDVSISSWDSLASIDKNGSTTIDSRVKTSDSNYVDTGSVSVHNKTDTGSSKTSRTSFVFTISILFLLLLAYLYYEYRKRVRRVL